MLWWLLGPDYLLNVVPAAVTLIWQGFTSLGNARQRDLGCSAPVQAGFVNPSVKRAPYIPYHAKHLPSGKDDPGKIPCGFAKEKKILVCSPWLKKVCVGILTTLVSWHVLLKHRPFGEGAAGVGSVLWFDCAGCGGCEKSCMEQEIWDTCSVVAIIFLPLS